MPFRANSYMDSVAIPPGVKVVNLGAWGDDPLVIQAIREKILECDPGLGVAAVK